MHKKATLGNLAAWPSALALVLIASGAAANDYIAAKSALLASQPLVRVFDLPQGTHAYSLSGLASATTAPNDRPAAVLSFVTGQPVVLGFDPAVMELSLDRRVAQRSGEVLRFVQTVDGLPVYGATILARFDRDGRLSKLSSTLASTQARSSTPQLTEGEAVTLAGEGFSASADYAAELGYLPLPDSLALVYKVIQDAPGPHRYVTFVDAIGGRVMLRHDAVRRHLARIYEHNPVVDAELTEVELQGIVPTGEHAMHTYGEYARVASCDELDMAMGSCSSSTYRAVATAENGFLDVAPVLSDDVFDDGFAELMVYYAVDGMSRWYRETFGLDVTFYDAEAFGASFELEEANHLWIYVNAEYPNGFFSPGMDYPGYERPDQVVLGSIYSKDLAYDNDVVTHEFTHAVSSKTFSIGMGDLDNLGINMSAGGIEEGTADYFSSVFAGDPNLGEYVGVDRVLVNDNVCPDDLLGESHHDGQIVAGAMWSIRAAIGTAKTDNLYFEALSSHELRNFDDLVSALRATANDLQDETDEALKITAADLAAIDEEIAARSLENCLRLVPLEPGMDPLLQYMAFGLTDEGTPSAVQYEVRTGPTTEALVLNISPMGDANYDVLVRKGEPVSYSWSESGWSYEFEATFDLDWRYDGDDAITEARISNATSVPLEKNAVYYFSIVCRPDMYSMNAMGCRNMLTVDLLDEPDDMPETTDDPDTDDSTDTGEAEDTESVSDDTADTDAPEQSKKDDDGCGCAAVGAWPTATNSLVSLLSSLL